MQKYVRRLHLSGKGNITMACSCLNVNIMLHLDSGLGGGDKLFEKTFQK